MAYASRHCDIRCRCNLHGVVNGNTNCNLIGECAHCNKKKGYTGKRCSECLHGYIKNGKLCKPCSCNIHGMQSCTNSHCHCKPGYKGPTCSDCDVGLYFPDIKVKICQPCGCFNLGTQTNKCNQNTGQCDCKPEFKGLQCKKCKKGFYLYAGVSCLKCDCNVHGVHKDECDGGGKCTCKQNYKGDKCTKCDDGFHLLPDQRCEACKCRSPGAKSIKCDAKGDCTCKSPYSGPKCGTCIVGFYMPSSYCIPCNCNKDGVVNGDLSCNKKSGQCKCDTVNGYTGKACSKCQNGFTKTGTKCTGCGCDPKGSFGTSCDGKGQCSCKPHNIGLRCGDCMDTFYKDGAGTCTFCACTIGAAVSLVCDKNTGTCTCKPNTVGTKCESCVSGYYMHQIDAVTSECRPCNCDKKGVLNGNMTCGPNGACYCNTAANFEGKKCDRCKVGFFLKNGVCSACNCCPSGVDKSDISCNDKGICNCDPKFEGDKCTRCKRSFFRDGLDCKPCGCDTGGTIQGTTNCNRIGICPCNKAAHFTGDKCDQCEKGYYHDGQNCQQCPCNPEGADECNKFQVCFCRIGYTGRKCHSCGYGFIQVGNKCLCPLGTFLDINVCRKCSCNIHGAQSMSCDQVSGKCTCKQNYHGDLCDKCSDGFHLLHNKKCEACSCKSYGAQHLTCDRNTGQCTCKTNYAGVNCETCTDGFHKLSNQTCATCKCNIHGAQTLTCDKSSGKCTCKQNYQGDLCDQCGFGFHLDPDKKCQACGCTSYGAIGNGCDGNTGQCTCKTQYTGQRCDRCTSGHYMLPTKYCRSCDCNKFGLAKGKTCDPVTGKCECDTKYKGIACDECADGYKKQRGRCIGKKKPQKKPKKPAQKGGSSAQSHPNCNKCVQEGTRACNQGTGKCTCKNNFAGTICEKCKSKFYLKNNKCTACRCHPQGSAKGAACDGQGKCTCKQGYTDHKCKNCVPGYKKHRKRFCKKAANPGASSAQKGGSSAKKPFSCNDCVKANKKGCNRKKKRCVCKNNFGGKYCDICKPNFYLKNKNDTNCTACGCIRLGLAKGNPCDPKGKCNCKPAFSGDPKCNSCSNGYKKRGRRCIKKG